MSALRTTRPDNRWPRGLCVRVAAALALPVGFLGCGTPPPPGEPPSPHDVGSYDPAWVTHRPELPAPETDRIGYDERTRTLTLYSLPGNGRWMVQMPGDLDGRIVSQQHHLPDGDTSVVLV